MSYMKKYADSFSPMAFDVFINTVMTVVVRISQAIHAAAVKIQSRFIILIHSDAMTEMLNRTEVHVSRPFDSLAVPV